MSNLAKGDLVLATEDLEGNPSIPYFIGYWDGVSEGRHTIVNSKGDPFNDEGFLKVKKISASEARIFLEERDGITNRKGYTVWFYLDVLRRLVSAREGLPEFSHSDVKLALRENYE